MSKTETMDLPESLRILAADLSLRCPGFAIQQYENGTVRIERLCHLNMRSSKAGHGEILDAIYDLLCELSADIDVFVREKGFYRFPHETQALFKVVGVADLTAWQMRCADYEEISPSAVKKLLAENGKASKNDVAMAQERFVGKQKYQANDESDAVAVGIAWLIQAKKL